MKAFVKDCTNFDGYLNDECKTRLVAVLENPTQETWNNAYSLIINNDKFMSLWQAWIKVDPNACICRTSAGDWPKIPDQLTLYRALKYATS
jgi:hypothetical protein